MVTASTGDVHGLDELLQALKYVDKGALKAVTKGLKEAAEPIRDSAEMMAGSRIRNIGPRWPRMRIGVSAAQGYVYMVPSSKNAGGPRRPNLAPLLMEQSMLPAVETHTDEILDNVEKALEILAADAGL